MIRKMSFILPLLKSYQIFVLIFLSSYFSSLPLKKFKLFKYLRYHRALMVDRSSPFFLFFTPSSPPSSPLFLSLSAETWYGCQVIDGCVRQSHESCFYSEALPYKPAAILGYWTHKLWSSRKSISYIDKHRHMHERMYERTEWNADGDCHVLAHTNANMHKAIVRHLRGISKHTLKSKASKHGQTSTLSH